MRRTNHHQQQRRLRALKSGWRARHGGRIPLDPDVADEYERRFYGCLYGARGPAWGLLENLGPREA